MRSYPRITRVFARRNILNSGEEILYVLKSRGLLKQRLIISNQRIFILQRMRGNEIVIDQVERIEGFRRRRELLFVPLQQILSVNMNDESFGADLVLRTKTTDLIIEKVRPRKAQLALNILQDLRNGQKRDINEQNVSSKQGERVDQNQSKKMIYCAKCGTENKIGSNFCISCGTSMAM